MGMHQKNYADALQVAITDLREAIETMENLTITAVQEQGGPALDQLWEARAGLHGTLNQLQQAASRIMTELRHLNELVRTAALITSTLDIDEVLEEVMDTIVDLAGAERAYLMLYDEDGDFRLRAARNWDQETLSDSDVGLSQSIVNAVIQSREPVVTTNAQSDQRFMAQESIVFQKLRSIICVPLSLSGTLIGVLYADNRYRQGAFGEEMVPILTAFGTQASIAIMNAQMFTHVQDNLTMAQQVIEDLRIEIDQERVDEQVRSITQSGFFQELHDAAREMRRRQKGEHGAE